jgi:hypothetical protein
MININKCKKTVKTLAAQSKKNLGDEKLEIFHKELDGIITQYDEKYSFYSTAIKLEAIDSFKILLANIAEIKNILTPIIVDKMVNEKDLYYLSLYQNFYAGTDLIPNIDSEYKSEYYENGGGENALALITGCHWIEQKEASELVE